MLKINEIFYSIQGETTYVGNPTVFVRLTACNLRCTYCDTKYSYYEGENKSLDSILSEIASHKTQYVCVTGGEPLLQKVSRKTEWLALGDGPSGPQYRGLGQRLLATGEFQTGLLEVRQIRFDIAPAADAAPD